MHIEISLQDGVPIYRQIANQVKYLIASGQLQTDEEPVSYTHLTLPTKRIV